MAEPIVPNPDLTCPWCGEDFPNQKQYDNHYRHCLVESEVKISDEDIFDLIHNPNNY